MARIQGSVATLRVNGDSLVPDEITKLLGCEPTVSHVKGQVFRGQSSGREVEMKFGSWRLREEGREPGDVNRQVSELLDKLTQDLNVWQSIASRFEVDLFLGLFMGKTNEGTLLSASTLKALGERKIALVLDVYAPTEEPRYENPCPCGSGKSYGECCGKYWLGHGIEQRPN